MKKKFFIFISLLLLGIGSIHAQLSKDSLILQASKLLRSTPAKSLYLIDSLTIAGHLTSTQNGMSLRIRGQALYISGKLKEAAVAFAESIKVLEAGNDKKEVGLTLIELAKLYRKLKMFQQAISTYQQAQRIFEEIDDKNNLATVLNEWGVVYEMMEDYLKAIDYYNQSLTIKQELNDSIGIAYSYSFLSYVYLLSNNFKLAEEYGVKSFHLFTSINDPISIALQSSDFALVYEKKGDYAQAIYYLEYSDSIAERMNYADLRSGNYERLANIYASLGKYNKAYAYRLKYADIKDSLFTSASQKAIAELNVQYQTAEKDNNLLLQQNRINNQRYLLVLSFLLLVIVSSLVAYIYRNKKQHEKQLQQEAAYQQELLKMEALNSMQQDRLRISRDLHDNIGAYLTYIKTNIEELSRYPVDNKQQFETLQELTSETISELRRTVWLINKPSVTIEEWIIRLKEHYKKIEQIAININISNTSKTLSALLATALYRIIQEAVTNAIKYSGCTGIRIDINSNEETLLFSVTDNGIGFDENEIKPGFGLNNMKQRAEEIGSKLKIESTPGKGTAISLQIKV